MKKIFIVVLAVALGFNFSFAQSKNEDIYVDYDGKKLILVTGERIKEAYRQMAGSCDLGSLRMMMSDTGEAGKRFLYVIRPEDINMILDDKGSTAFNLAASRNVERCRKTARWLSDMGVKDGLTGGAGAFIEVVPFKKPYIFEDARIKLEVFLIARDGSLYANLYNKTDDDIQYVGHKYTLNGKTEDNYEKNSDYEVEPKGTSEICFSAYNFYDLDPTGGPKVVKNQITFDSRSDVDFIYRYKNKEYKVKLKTAAGKETYDVYYINEGKWAKIDEYRKEQLGY